MISKITPVTAIANQFPLKNLIIKAINGPRINNTVDISPLSNSKTLSPNSPIFSLKKLIPLIFANLLTPELVYLR